jgi:hypothetical protein
MLIVTPSNWLTGCSSLQFSSSNTQINTFNCNDSQFRFSKPQKTRERLSDRHFLRVHPKINGRILSENAFHPSPQLHRLELHLGLRTAKRGSKFKFMSSQLRERLNGSESYPEMVRSIVHTNSQSLFTHSFNFIQSQIMTFKNTDNRHDK